MTGEIDWLIEREFENGAIRHEFQVAVQYGATYEPADSSVGLAATHDVWIIDVLMHTNPPRRLPTVDELPPFGLTSQETADILETIRQQLADTEE